MTIVPGIYKIQSIIHPERFYIGSAVYFKNRWAMHLNDLKKNKHHASKLQNHYNKYGKDDLVFIIVEPCLPEFLITREQYYLDTLKPFFNSSKLASSNRGCKWSDEDRKKQSERMKGKPSWRKGKKGKKMSDEFKKKCSERMKGNKFAKGKHWTWTEEQLEKLRGENNHFFGKTHPDEIMEKIMTTKFKRGLLRPSN